MKNRFINSIGLFVSFVLGLSAFASEVPFKYPDIGGQHFSELLSSRGKVAVVLGAGPAGLLASLLLEQNGYFVVLIEQRDQFSRHNTVSTQPETLPMLRRLGVLEEFKKTAIFSKEFHGFIEGGSQVIGLQGTFMGDLEHVNYSLPMPKALNPELWPHYAIEISRLQVMLSEKAILSENIVLLHGKGEILLDESDRKLNSLRFISSVKDFSGFVIDKPDLILVAEGAHSTSRDQQLKIPFYPTVLDSLGGGKEYWCSGVVSLEGVRPNDQLFGHMSLVVNPPAGLAVWGVFRPEYNDLFLNGQASEKEKPYSDVEDCLQQNAYWILKHEDGFLKTKLPESAKQLRVVQEKSSKFELTLKMADRFYSGRNTVLLGDSAGNGSPRGGLGWNLVSTVYMDALEKLVQSSSRKEALKIYNQRLMEIVKHWHFSLKDGIN